MADSGLLPWNFMVAPPSSAAETKHTHEAGRPLQMAANDSRSTWWNQVLDRHPELQNLQQRLLPLERALALVRTYNVGRPEVKKALDRTVIQQLIIQHLRYCGLRKSAKVLEAESGVKYAGPLVESALHNHLREAVRNTERIYDLVIDHKFHNEEDAERLLEDHLVSLGLVEEEKLGGDTDTNIWLDDSKVVYVDEKEASSLVDDGSGSRKLTKVIKAASINKLIQKLTSEKEPDMTYVRTFLLTYQSFISPEQLFHKLLQRFQVPDSKRGTLDEKEFRAKVVVPIQLRVINALRKWVEEHFTDFTDELLSDLQGFIEGLRGSGSHSHLAAMLHKSLSKKLAERAAGDRKRGQQQQQFNEPPPEPKVPRDKIFSPQLSLVHIDEEEIARQLTLIEFEYFSSIKPSELLNQAWNKPKLRHRAPNVLAMIHRFNALSLWVASQIVKVEQTRLRARMLAKFIKIAEHLRHLNNFSTLMAVLAGINNTAVFRLRATRDELPRQAVQARAELEALMSSEASFKNYRDLMAVLEPPCVPYLGIYLTDLTFIEDGNPDYTSGMVNFAKCRLIYSVIEKLQRLQQVPYNLQPVYQIQVFLRKPQHLNEQELYDLSCLREARKPAG